MSKALAFLAGLGQGYFKAEDQKEEKARRKRADERDEQRFQGEQEEREHKKRTRQALATAAAPATLDTANDLTHDDEGNAMPAVPRHRVVAGGGVQRFETTAEAQAAAAAHDQPQAVRARQVAALQGLDPERALVLEKTGTEMENARTDRARKLKEEGVFDALRAFRAGDAVGMKDAFNKSGQFKIDGDVAITPQEREIPGVGKVTTYTATFTATGPDGKPVQKSFNSHDLSLQMMPYEKALDLTQKGTKEAREERESTAKIGEAEAKAGYYRSASGAQDAKAAGGTGKPQKLDEDDKIRITTANTRVRDAEKAVVDAMGKLMPGEDASKNQGVAFAQGLLRQAKLEHLRTNIELGQIAPKAMVTQILAVAKSPQDVMKSLNELATVGGTEYADQVAAEIQASDAWTRMNPQPKAKPSTKPGAKPAAAGGMPAAAQGPGAQPKTAPATPQEAAGQRLDEAREVVRRLQASAPGLAKGKQAIEEHAAAVEAARQELREAEAAYQRTVQVQPYFGGGRPAAAAGMTAAR